MSRFLDHAGEIFETASATPGEGSSALTILIHSQGQIHIVDGAETPLDSLQARHGCRSAFRVIRNGAGVRVEGREGSSTCVLEDRVAGPARRAPKIPAGLFCDRPLYSVSSALLLA